MTSRLKVLLSAVALLIGQRATFAQFQVSTPYGPVEVRVSNAATELIATKSILKVTGTVANQSSIALDGVVLKPVWKLKNGRIVSADQGYQQATVYKTMAPGTEYGFDFSGGLVDFSAKDVESLSWTGEFNASVQYMVKSATLTKELQGVKVTATLDKTNVGVNVENNTENPVEIVWNDSSIIGLSRKANRVFHVGVKYSDRHNAQPNTVIPPLARVEDEVTPSDNAYFVEGRYGGWTTNPILPDKVPIEKLNVVSAAVGGKIGLFLQLQINGKKVPASFLFEIVRQ